MPEAKMEAKISTPTGSTVASSSLSYQSQPPAFRLLEISLISAQDLFPVSKGMQTYAITWIHSNRKLRTRVDQHGHSNPTWNDKFAFRVDDEFLYADDSAVKVEIYTTSWFRDVLVGTVHVLMSNLLTSQQLQVPGNKRYVALQIRRPSGSPRGILNMGVSLADSSMHMSNEDENHSSIIEESNREKIHLWRSLSMGTNEDFPGKSGSVVYGSMVNSELCSDVGPSASVVAAEIAQKSRQCQSVEQTRKNEEMNESESIILEELTEEEATAKGLNGNVRWRKGSEIDFDNPETTITGNSRRHSDGGKWSCFAYGFHVSIACGASNNAPKPVKAKNRMKTRSSEVNSA